MVLLLLHYNENPRIEANIIIIGEHEQRETLILFSSVVKKTYLKCDKIHYWRSIEINYTKTDV